MGCLRLIFACCISEKHSDRADWLIIAGNLILCLLCAVPPLDGRPGPLLQYIHTCRSHGSRSSSPPSIALCSVLRAPICSTSLFQRFDWLFHCILSTGLELVAIFTWLPVSHTMYSRNSWNCETPDMCSLHLHLWLTYGFVSFWPLAFLHVSLAVKILEPTTMSKWLAHFWFGWLTTRQWSCRLTVFFAEKIGERSMTVLADLPPDGWP